MIETMTCVVMRYLNDAVEVKLSNGIKGILHSKEITDVSIPVEEKVYVGQTLTVLVEYTSAGLRSDHKSLLEDKDRFFAEHLGDTVKARVVYSTPVGCLVELASNVRYFVKGMCNISKGRMVWVSITMWGKVMIDSILYDEEIYTYPEYKYNASYANAGVQQDYPKVA